MTFSKKKTTPLHSTHSTELFKIFFSLLTLSTAFLQKTSGPGNNLVKRKIRSNFCDPSSPSALTKKFWSYVKSNSNTSRIPTSVHRAEIHANDDVKQAELFNTFFHEQFSPSSNYEINIDTN